MAEEVGLAYVRILPSMRGFSGEISKGFKDADGPAEEAGKESGKRFGSGFSDTVKTAMKAAVIAGSAAAGAFAVKAIGAASDLNENISKVNTVFGKSAGAIQAWSKTTASSIGLSRNEALEAVGAFGNMFDQLGIGSQQSLKMSTGMVKLAADFASFHNADITEVLDAQQAAFRGEYDSLQRFLPLINGATVEQKAMAMTGKASAKALTAQEKALAVNALMMEGAGEAAGDFQRTSGSLANQIRILKARATDLAANVGQALIPVVLKGLEIFRALSKTLSNAVKPAIEFVAGAAKETFNILFKGDFKGVGPFSEDSPFVDTVFDVREALMGFGKFVGGTAKEIFNILFKGDFKGVGPFSEDSPFIDKVFDVREALIGFGKIVKDNLAPILAAIAAVVVGQVVPSFIAWATTTWAAVTAQIALAAPAIAAAAAIAGLAAGVVYAYQHFEDFRDVVDSVASFLTGTVAPKVAEFAAYVVAQFGNLVTWVRQFWPQVSEAITHVMNVVQGIVRTTIDIVSALWRQWGDDLLRIVKTIWNGIRETIENAIQLVRGVIQTVVALINGDWGKAWDGIKDIVGAVWDQIGNVISTAVGGIKSLFGGLASTGADVFKTMVDKIVEFLLSIPGRIANLGKDILSKLLPDIPGGGVLKSVLGSLPGFGGGGFVSGPTGSPSLAVVHGGEAVFTPDQLAAIGKAIAAPAFSEQRGSGRNTPVFGGDLVLQGADMSPADISAELAWWSKVSGR